VTCLVDQLMPEVGVATVRLLRRAGYQVDFPTDQTCCGQPFFNSGFRPEATDLAKRTIEILRPYEMVVAPSGSCTTMIRAEYPHLLEDDPAWYEQAKKLADKTYELSEFLVQKAKWTPPAHPDAPAVTYHDSCHMCRMLHLKTEPRTALNQVGCSISEMKEADRCCGFGGLFSIRMPEVSNAMTTEKLQQASQTEGTMLVTADPGCLMQMRGLAEQNNVRVEHLAIILEENSR
jgi:L-lactate dehydrogenase complex protein LldE